MLTERVYANHDFQGRLPVVEDIYDGHRLVHTLLPMHSRSPEWACRHVIGIRVLDAGRRRCWKVAEDAQETLLDRVS
jgi:hypothetical protein